MTVDQIFPRLGPIDQQAAATLWMLNQLPQDLREWVYRTTGKTKGGLTQATYWRLLPYGYWTDAAGNQIYFDRNYFPILLIDRVGKRQLFHPLERINRVKQAHFYEDATAPYISNATLPIILNIAAAWGVAGEIEYRWRLSDYGKRDKEEWGSMWRSP